jgi:hypothetical protein
MVVTHAVGGGGAHEDVQVVVEIDGDAFNARLACILEAIAIQVFPNIIANGDGSGNRGSL